MSEKAKSDGSYGQKLVIEFTIMPDLAKLAGRVCAFTPKTPAGGSLAPHTPTPIPARWEKDALRAAAEWLEDKLC